MSNLHAGGRRGAGRPVMPRRTGNVVANRNGEGGGLARLQGRQEVARQRWNDLGLCSYDSRTAAEGRRLLCDNCIEKKERATDGQA